MSAALIVRNHDLCMDRARKALLEIQQHTEDQILKKQIRKYLKDGQSCLESFCGVTEGDIYRLLKRDGSQGVYTDAGYYDRPETAASVIPGLRSECLIEKYRLIRQKDPIIYGKKRENLWKRTGWARYNRKGERCEIWGPPGKDPSLWKTPPFAERYYHYPHPFRRGDILKRTGEEEVLYIVLMHEDPEVEEKREKLFASAGKYTDIGISTININRKAGTIFETADRIHPYEFEYAQPDQETSDRAERAALEIQSLLRGGYGSLQYLSALCSGMKNGDS